MQCIKSVPKPLPTVDVVCITNHKTKVSIETVPVELNCSHYLADLPKKPTALIDELVTSAVWTADAGVIITNTIIQSPMVYCQINGGNIGSIATITCLITTTSLSTKQFKYTCLIT